MRIVFFGSDDFAAVCLQGLLKSSHEIVGCVTQPDARQGRGMKMSLSPIKELAVAHDCVCLQPNSLKEAEILETLKSLAADVFVVVAYGRILPQSVLDIPKLLCVNVHGSLLPKYRGAAPVNWAIIHGDQETGVTIMKMAAQMDAGDVISQKRMPLRADITADRLREAMAIEGANLLVQTIDRIASGQYTLIPQDESKVTLAPKLTKEMGKIDWIKKAIEIERLIRGLKPWPGTYTTYQGKTLKILQAKLVPAQGQPGTILNIDKQGFVVACGQDALLVSQVHLEASKPTSAYDFIQGHRLNAGQVLE